MLRRMVRLLLLVLLAVIAIASPAATTNQPPSPEVTSVALKFIPGPASLVPTLTRAPDGVVWLSWVESTPGGHAVRCASFDASLRRWSDPFTIVSGAHVSAPDAGPPVLAVGAGGRLSALWLQTSSGPQPATTLFFSTSADGGRTWVAPAPLTTGSPATASPALTVLADGRLLAAWLDRRGSAFAESDVRLYARILGPSGGPDILVAPRVSEHCAPALGSFPDGSAILSYRGLDKSNVRDPHVVRFLRDAWSGDHVLNDDQWRTPTCPGEGPRLAVSGGRVASTWFTAADSQPRAQLSVSSDAGTRFLMPLTLDFGNPVGHPAVALLHHGAMISLWREGASGTRPAGLWLRRASPAYSLDPPVLLAADTVAPVIGQPQIAVLRDFSGGDSSAELIVAYVTAESGNRIHTLHVTVPEGALLAAAAECGCAPTADEALGYPIRGAFTALDPARGEVTVKHTELPGLLPAGPTVFKVAPGVFASAQVGRDFLGRVELQEGRWRLFNIRLLIAPPARK